MILVNNINSLAAELQVAIISDASGLLLRDQIRWQLIALATHTVHTSEQAKATFAVTEGEYELSVSYQDAPFISLERMFLSKNTRADVIYIWHDGDITAMQDYFSEYDSQHDFSRRREERELQSQHGVATMPLRDPDMQQQGDYGTQLMGHPLLQTAQFDGVPPDIRPDPSENQQAVQLTLTQKLAAQAAPSSAPSLTR